MKIQSVEAGWQIMDPSTGWKIEFGCSAQITIGERKFLSTDIPWQTVCSTDEEVTAQCDCHGVIQEVTLKRCAATRAVKVWHRIRNNIAETVSVDSIRTLDGVLEATERLTAPAYLHSLNTREPVQTTETKIDKHLIALDCLNSLNSKDERQPLCLLKKEIPSLLLGRVNYPFLEGLVVWQGTDRPCVVTGALTQRIVHRSQQLIWDGDRRVTLKTEQDLRGIERKAIEAGQTLELDGVFIQCRLNGEVNEVFTDYLLALRQVNGTRWEKNQLRDKLFFDPWNNYLYWEATADELLGAARQVKKHFHSVTWIGVDDGYQKSTAPDPKLQRHPNGELDYVHSTELAWYNHCPGIGFGFPNSLGEDKKKLPAGLLGLASNLHELGLRPELWVGMEISKHYPLAKQHPEWFHSLEMGEHLLLDISVPEVRANIEYVFQTYFGKGKFEAIKLDFWSHLFEEPTLKFRCQDKTAAEWRQWLFELIRHYLPDDGFISIACSIAAGAPFLSPWVDSYRFGADLRDGDWKSIKDSVRWSLIPLLTHGFGQPIADADTLSLLKRLSRAELDCWTNYAYVTGSMVELGGNPVRWDAEGVSWLRGYLDRPCAGERVWIGDGACWGRDALPRVVYRAEKAGGDGSYLVSLHNWTDAPVKLTPGEWSGPVGECLFYSDMGSTEKLEYAVFELPPRSGKLIRVSK